MIVSQKSSLVVSHGGIIFGGKFGLGTLSQSQRGISPPWYHDLGADFVRRVLPVASPGLASLDFQQRRDPMVTKSQEGLEC